MNSQLHSTRTFSTSNSDYTIQEDGILRIRKKEIEPDINSIQDNVNNLKEFLAGNKYPTILNNTGMPYAGKQARLIMARELPEICKALAIVSEDQASADLAYLFMAMTPLPIKVQRFDNELDAELWLKSLFWD